MTLDLNTMPTSSSPLALLAGQPAPAASDEFATLFDLGAATIPPAKTPAVATPTPPIPASADVAIAQADALVSALTPEAEPVREIVETPPAAPVPLAIQQIVRPPLRGPGRLPDETVKGRSDLKPKAEEPPEEVEGPPPAILVLPEAAPPVANQNIGIPLAIAQPDAPIAANVDHTVVEGEAIVASAKAAPAELAPVAIAPARAESSVLPVIPASVQAAHAPATSKAVHEPDHKASGTATPAPELSSVPSFAFVAKAAADAPTAISATSNVAAAIAAPAADAVVERQLDLVRDEQWLGELAHDIASTSGDKDRLAFRLMPPQLGRLDIDLSRTPDGLSLTIRTESDSAQAILSAAQPRLAEEIRAQGLKLTDAQTFSSDARQSHGQDNDSNRAALIEAIATQSETTEAPEEERRDGRYA